MRKSRSLTCTVLTSSFLLALFVALGWPAGAAAETATAEVSTAEPLLSFRDHDFELGAGRTVAAQWGTLEVPELRGDPASRRLSLALVRLPSTATEPGPPIIFLAGGPGSSGIDAGRGSWGTLFDALRQQGDVLLLDQRGTGRSRPTSVCRQSWSHPLDQPLSRETALAEIRRQARDCVAGLRAEGTAVEAYNPIEIADDIEDLRRALGVPQVDLLATSFGSYLALATLRRHEDSLRRLVLLGVVGPDQTLKSPRLVEARLAQIGGDDVLDGADASLAGRVGQVLGSLEMAPTTSAFDPLSNQEVELRVGAFDLQLATVRGLGGRRSLARLDEVYNQLTDGEFSPLANDLRAVRRQWLGHLMPYAVICSAGSSAERRQEVLAQAQETALGRTLDFPFPEICDDLGIGLAAPELLQPIASAKPVLMVSGTADVRTPLENAEQVLAGLPNGRHLIVDGAGHGNDLLFAAPAVAGEISAFLAGQEISSQRLRAEPLWRQVPAPPTTKIKPVVETLHGTEIRDPYRWLEDEVDLETKLWIQRQNRYTDSVLQVLPGRQALSRHFEDLLRVETVGRPWQRGERSIYQRRRPQQEFSSIVLRQGGAAEEVLIEPSAATGTAAGVRILDVSADGALLAYAVFASGADEIEIAFYDVDERRTLDRRLPRARYFGLAILPGNRELYYGREKDESSGAGLFLHRLGSDPQTDAQVFGQDYGRGSTVWGQLSDDGRYLVAHALDATQRGVDVFVQDLAGGGEMLEVVRGIDAKFYGGVLGGRLILQTDWQAPQGRIFSVDPARPGPENWQELVPERDGAVIRTVFGAAGRLFVEYLENVQSRLAVFDLTGREVGEVRLPTIGTVDGIRGRWEEDEVFFTFSSFHLPPAVYRYRASSGEVDPWHRAELPIDAVSVDAGDLEIRQVRYASADGTAVPMFLIHRRGLRLDGSHPTLLRGYGGFGTSLTPSFNQEVAAWVQRGGVYAVANVRGGGELGSDWHLAGMREHKQRSFDDFIAAAEWLIARRYTRPAKLALTGHSNGGLLVAAAATQRPDLFRAVVCSHPLLDMLRYNQFLAARFWIAEYGTSQKQKYFEPLYAYSPYHRLDESQRQPAMLFITAADDTRVAPLHARKMTARMQALAAADRPVLLRHHDRAGHSGQGMSTRGRIAELTDTMSFLLWQLGELGEPGGAGDAETGQTAAADWAP